MPIGSDPLDELAIPDGTTVEEHDLVTDGDVIVGGQSTVEFGIRAADVVAGERVDFGGHIEAAGDCRLDMWSDVDEDVLVGGDAYLGERVRVGGELKVAGNVDIGDDVDIEESFEANGHIEIRNPMPTIVFLVVYLSQLLRIGEEEAAENLASQLVEADEGPQPVVIPRSAHVSDERWRVSTPARVGADCRLHGNLRAESLTVAESTTIFGSLRAKGDVTVGEAVEVKGDVTTRNGDVFVASDAHIWGDISADDVELHEHAVVEGRIRVSGELTQIRDALGPEPAPGDRQSSHDATDDEGAADADATHDTDADADVDGDGKVDATTNADAEADADADADVDQAPDTGTTTEASDSTAPQTGSPSGAGEGKDDPDHPATAVAESIESREALEQSLDGVVPLADADAESADRADDAELASDAD